ncbi:hypothetical protein K2X33_05180, partial [bacterium]|nr:hypothetical protein [bacterium]
TTVFGYSAELFLFVCMVVGGLFRFPRAPFHGSLRAWSERSAFPGGWVLPAWSGLAATFFFTQWVAPVFPQAAPAFSNLGMGIALLGLFYAAAAAATAPRIGDWYTAAALVFNAVGFLVIVTSNHQGIPSGPLLSAFGPTAALAVLLCFPSAQTAYSDLRADVGFSLWGRLALAAALLAVAGFPGSNLSHVLLLKSAPVLQANVEVFLLAAIAWTVFIASLLHWAVALQKPEATAAPTRLPRVALLFIVGAWALIYLWFGRS